MGGDGVVLTLHDGPTGRWTETSIPVGLMPTGAYIPQSTHQSLLDSVEALAGLLRAAVLMPRRECDNTIVEIETELRRLVADAKNGEPK